MLPAEMADGTRAQVQRRREEAEAAEEGNANPAPNPEVVLPNNQDGDNPLVIPDREEDETRDEYAVRVMQAVSQHQIHSFQSDDTINEGHLQGSKEEKEARMGRDR